MKIKINQNVFNKLPWFEKVQIIFSIFIIAPIIHFVLWVLGHEQE